MKKVLIVFVVSLSLISNSFAGKRDKLLANEVRDYGTDVEGPPAPQTTTPPDEHQMDAMATALSTYGANATQSIESRQVIRQAVSVGSSFLGTAYLYSLGKEMADSLLPPAAHPVSYFVGVLSYAPIGYIVSKLVDADLTTLQELSTSAETKALWQKKGMTYYTIQAAEWLTGAMTATAGVYYSYVYFNKPMEHAVWVVAVPSAFTMTILGKKAIESFFNSLAQTARSLMPSQKSDIQLRQDVSRKFDLAINEIKDLSEEKAAEIFESLKVSPFCENEQMAALFKQEITTEQPSSDRSRLAYIADMTGGAMGVLGSVAMIPITKRSAAWCLSSCGVPEEIVEPISTVVGYIGGIGIGAFKGMGSKETIKKLSGYVQACFGKAKKIPLKTKIADSFAGVFSVLGTASRAELVTQAGMTNPVFAAVIMACNVVSTSSNDFFGWQGLMTEISEFKDSRTSKSLLVKVFKKMKAKLVQDGNSDALHLFLNVTQNDAETGHAVKNIQEE